MPMLRSLNSLVKYVNPLPAHPSVVATSPSLPRSVTLLLLWAGFALAGLGLLAVAQSSVQPARLGIAWQVSHLLQWAGLSLILFLVGRTLVRRKWHRSLPESLLAALVLTSPILWQVTYARVYQVLNTADAYLSFFWLQILLDIGLIAAGSALVLRRAGQGLGSLPKINWFPIISSLIVFGLSFYLWSYSTLYIFLVILFSLAANFLFTRQVHRLFISRWLAGLLIYTLLAGVVMLRATSQAKPQPGLISSSFSYDLLFVGLLLGLVLLVQALTPQRLKRSATLGLGLVCFGLSVGLSLAFAYTATVGVEVNLFWLQFFTHNFRDSLPYIVEVSPSVAVTLGLGFPLLTLLVWGWFYRELPRATTLAAPPRLVGRLLQAGLALALMQLIAMTVINRYQLPPARQNVNFVWAENTYFALAYDLYHDLAYSTTAQAASDGLAFDTDQLRFVETPATIRPNIVLIILESTRRASVTPYQPELATTPFLDRLAKKSLLVDDFNVAVPFSNDSIMTLLTGNYSDGNYGGIVHAGLPELLAPLGYRSAYFTPYSFEFLQYGQMLQRLGYQNLMGYSQLDQSQYNHFGSSDYLLLEPSLAWVDKQVAAHNPFLLTIFTQSCHHPYDNNIPEVYRSQTIFRAHAGDNDDLNSYLNCLNHLDKVVETMMAEFEQRGLESSTIFFISGDHGELFGEHGEYLHGEVVWQPGLQVPAMLYAPGLKLDPATITGLRQQIDLLPTLADLLEVEVTGGTLPGRSLLEPADENRSLFIRTFSAARLVLREGPLKYIFDMEKGTAQVFNLADDPQEQSDIAAQFSAEYLEARRQMSVLWYEQTKR